jgi:uncharacterized membrane protein YccC
MSDFFPNLNFLRLIRLPRRIPKLIPKILPDRGTLLVQGLKTGLAAGLCFWVTPLVHLHQGQWAAISAIVVLQSNVGSTVRASRDRFFGTVIGALLGYLATITPWANWAVTYSVTVMAALLLCAALRLKNSSRLAAITLTIVMATHSPGSHWSIALERFLEVNLGIVIALSVSNFVLPRRAREYLRHGLAEEFRTMGTFFVAILDSYRNKPVENLAELHAATGALVLGNDQLMRAARSEPASGPASVEGLSLLIEFGRSLHDALLALEIAIQESTQDRFSQNQEPELGLLISHTHEAFDYVAECIRLWRFHIPPSSWNLEEDIRALETRSKQNRHTALTFPQEEVLRNFAVQVHLKQVARLLRTARLEANEATGGADL